MIQIDLQKFGGRGGKSGAGGAGGKGGASGNGSTSTNAPGSGHGGGSSNMSGGIQQSAERKRETQETVESRILDSRGNVKAIENGQRYDIYNYNVKEDKESVYDRKYSAADTRDFLEGYTYNEETGTFTDGYGRHYRVKLVRKKK